MPLWLVLTSFGSHDGGDQLAHAVGFGDEGRADELRESLALRRKALPAEHRDVAKSLNNLAVLLYNQDRYAEAELLSREAVAMIRKLLPAGHPDIAATIEGLAARGSGLAQ